MNGKGDKCVLLFVKSPRCGWVKTRLAGQLGAEFAAEVYKHFVIDTLEMLGNLSCDLRIFFDPLRDEEKFKRWLGSMYSYVPQQGGNLGQKMENAFRHVFAEGFSKAVVIGSDAPDLPAGFIESALRVLDFYDTVVGPADDGGYYLLGFSKQSFLPDAFEKITWSSSSVCTQTLSVLEKHSRTFYLLPQWCDVDTLADLRTLILRNKNTAFYHSETMQFLLNSGIIPEAASLIWSTENV